MCLKSVKLPSGGFFCSRKTIDEEELQAYLDAIDNLDSRIEVRGPDAFDILEQLRDEYGYRVPGCYYTRSVPTTG